MFLYFNFFLNIFHIVQNYYDRIVIKFLVKKFPIEISWKIKMTRWLQMIKFLNSTYLLNKNYYDQTYQLLPYTIFNNFTKNESNVQSAIHHIWTYKLFWYSTKIRKSRLLVTFFFFFFALISLTSLSQLKSLHRSNFTNRIKSRNLSHILLNKFSLFNNRNQTRWIFPVLNETTKPPLARYIFISFFSLISFASLT